MPRRWRTCLATWRWSQRRLRSARCAWRQATTATRPPCGALPPQLSSTGSASAPPRTWAALECLGGNGFVEESGMPLFYRDAPVSSIWEGSGNVCALDALRAIDRQPQSLEAFLAECELAKGASRTLDHSLLQLRADCEELLGALRSQRAGALAAQFSARALVERLALTLQASLLARHSPDFIAEPFIATRLGKQGGHSYGTLPGSAPVESIIDRALPAE